MAININTFKLIQVLNEDIKIKNVPTIMLTDETLMPEMQHLINGSAMRVWQMDQHKPEDLTQDVHTQIGD